MYTDYNGENTFIETENAKIQISTLESQKDSKFSNIDLGKCGEILKEKYCKTDNDSLIMLKYDLIPENETSTYVQYEIYDQNTKSFIDLKECSGTSVTVKVPIELDSEIESLYNMFSKSGYNLFDANDSFYNDICAVYTTENGTDILLYDRRMGIYQSTLNISLCQKGCLFKSYDSETKKAECDCQIQTEEVNLDLNNLKFDKNEMLDEFYETLQNSNFRVLKCYKLLYNTQVIKKNIGSIIMTILLILFLILMIIYIFKNSKKIDFFIQTIIKNKYIDDSNKNDVDNKGLDKKNKLKLKDGYKAETETNKEKHRSEEKRIKELNNKIESINPPRRKINQENNNKNISIAINTKTPGQNQESNNNCISSNPAFFEKININNNMILIENRIGNKDDIYNKKLNNNTSRQNITNYSVSKKLEKSEISQINSIKPKNKKKKKEKKVKFSPISPKILTDSKKISSPNELLNDQEMNSLEYEKAIELDKRTYFQYYLSLIKKKHLILFTFMPTNDYNVITLKISLFIVSFSLYLTINTFFFNDDTMHKIYQESGVFNIIQQIPQILYSSIISSIINMLLKTLSLSEKDIVVTVQKSKKIERCFKIKIILFFIIGLSLMLFFWYFISCFLEYMEILKLFCLNLKK